MRIALAKLLLRQPDLLLLDEPTNHLDLEARNWLEEYLNAYPHAVILVSHDRFFLDAVVTRIADLTLRTLTDYLGNYSDYLVEREARIEQMRKAKREQDEEVARVKMFIDRFRYQATKASQVQSRIKMLEKVVPIEVPPERKKIHFTFPVCAKSGRTVLELKHVRKAYGDLVVFKDLNLHIERGDRIALVGPNGAGKSTLMRMLSGEEAPDSGERIEGHQVVTQYFAQDEATRLDPNPTVYETLSSGSPIHMVPTIRNILGGFLFSGDDIYKKVGVLSGGERTRLAVARMLLRPSNTLLLDEPTNHLDLDSKDVLLDALVDYGGTLIFVSHDRYFVERLATKVIEVGSGRRARLPGHLQGVPLAQGTSRGAAGTAAPRQDLTAQQKARADPDKPRSGEGRSRRRPLEHATARRSPASGAPAAAQPRRTQATRRRGRRKMTRRTGAQGRGRAPRGPHRRDRGRDSGARGAHGRAGVLRRPRRRAAAADRAPGADVEGRRADARGKICRPTLTLAARQRPITIPSFDYRSVSGCTIGLPAHPRRPSTDYAAFRGHAGHWRGHIPCACGPS